MGRTKMKRPAKVKETFKTTFGAELGVKLIVKDESKATSILKKLNKKVNTDWELKETTLIPVSEANNDKVNVWFNTLAVIVTAALKDKKMFIAESYISYRTYGPQQFSEYGTLYIPACKNSGDFRIIVDNYGKKTIYTMDDDGDSMGQTTLNPFKDNRAPNMPTFAINMIYADYAVYAPGYVDRLRKHKDEIEEKLNDMMYEGESNILFMIEDNEEALRLINDGEDEDDIIKTLVDNNMAGGTICIKNPPSILDAQDILTSYNHAAFFRHPSEVRGFITKTGRTLTWLNYDTESG